jgi:acyl-CoA reductase-like NAD-dependent aldehyde dehydrogenase
MAGTGKPQRDAAAEVMAAVEVFRFYAGAARASTTPASGALIPSHESWVRWEPLGVVGVIVPWNYPLMMAAWRCAPALAAGNTVVLKPAETTPDSARLLAAYATEHLGPGVLTTVPGTRHTGRLLVDSSVDMIAFTGSVAAGRDIAARAGVRPVSLELGGNCPAIVLPDAPSYTFDELALAMTYNAGQSCAAPARVITLWSNYGAVVAGLRSAIERFAAGMDFGPLNNPDQLARYDKLVGNRPVDSVHQGPVAPVPEQESGYWRPTAVINHVQPDDPAVTEEVFGPVLTVQSARDLTAAVELANSQRQGLAASVWTSDVTTAMTASQQLRAGEVWVNCHLVQTAELPHSGQGDSGNGVDLSVLALGTYRRPKTVTVYVPHSRAN